MAWYKCKNCGEEVTFGWMPTATCGLLLVPAVAAALVSPIIGWARLHWFALLLPVPAFFVVMFVTVYVPQELEWLCVHWHRCSNCGRHRWSQPYTRGFGL